MKNYKKIIKKIAKMNGVSVKEVETDMKAAINYAYKKPSLTANCIPKDNEIPAPKEVISYASERVNLLK